MRRAALCVAGHDEANVCGLLIRALLELSDKEKQPYLDATFSERVQHKRLSMPCLSSYAM